MNIEFHPLAELFPLMDGDEFAALIADIKANGLREPIVLHDGKILDGRNRYRACVQAGVRPTLQEWNQEGSAQAFVISKNLHRRHLSESQRAMIAARLVTTDKSGGGRLTSCKQKVTNEQAAALLNVGADTVSCARTVLREGTEAEIKAIECGDATVNTVAREIRRKTPAESRAVSKREIQARRTQTTQMQADIWQRLKEALEHLTSLPLPSDVVLIARNKDKRSNGAAINHKLKPSLEWLKEFDHAWNAGSDQR